MIGRGWSRALLALLLPALVLVACEQAPEAAPGPAPTATLTPAPTATPTAPGSEGTPVRSAAAGIVLVDVVGGSGVGIYDGKDLRFATFDPACDGFWMHLPATDEAAFIGLDGVEAERDERSDIVIPGWTRYSRVSGHRPERCEPAEGGGSVIDGEPFDVPCGSFSPDGLLMLYERPVGAPTDGSAATLFEVGILDLQTGEGRTFAADVRHNRADFAALPSWSPSGRYVVVLERLVTEDGRVFVLDAETGETTVLGEPIAARSDFREGPVWSADDWLAVASENGSTVIVDPARGEQIEVAGVPWPARFDASGRYVYGPYFGAAPIAVAESETADVVVEAAGRFVPDSFDVERRVAAVEDGVRLLLDEAPGCDGMLLIDTAAASERCLEAVENGSFGPDGAWLLYAARRAVGGWSVVLLDPVSGVERLVIEEVPEGDADAGPGVGSRPPVLEWNAAGTHVLVIWPGWRGVA